MSRTKPRCTRNGAGGQGMRTVVLKPSVTHECNHTKIRDICQFQSFYAFTGLIIV